MRKLKDGTVKYKASAYKEQDRLARSPFPIPRFVIGAKVKVYMGAGWSVGYVELSQQDKCVVRMAVGNRSITVNDARCIQSGE
jgi:hypothetical protein